MVRRRAGGELQLVVMMALTSAFAIEYAESISIAYVDNVEGNNVYR